MERKYGNKWGIALKLALAVLVGAGLWIVGAPRQASADAKSAPGVAAGGQSSFALLADDALMVWGRNEMQQLGGVTTDEQVLSPTMHYLEDVQSVHAGRRHTLVVMKDGRLLGFGANYNSQLGYPYSFTYMTVAAIVPGLDDVKAAAAGVNFSMALKGDETVWVWGYNPFFPQLADGVAINPDGTLSAGQHTPEQVPGLANIKAIAAGDNYAGAIDENGDLYMWGDNEFGQLGTGDNNPRPTPVKVAFGIKSVAVSDNHTVAVKVDGTVIAFGKNEMGQLGDGTNAPSNLPVNVIGLTDIKEVALGDDHSLALGENGQVYAWGSNYQGRLGNGTASPSATPINLIGLNNVVAIAAGFAHSMAMTGDGHVYSWGFNDKGQLGNGTTDDQYSPVMVIDYGPPSTPTELNVRRTILDLGKANLSWQPSPEPDIEYYTIYMRKQGEPAFFTSFRIYGGATTYTVSGIQQSKTYEFKIEAVDTSGFKSPQSDIVILEGLNIRKLKS